MYIIEKYNNILKQFEAISLENMNSLELLKRQDTKYVFPIEKLQDLLLIVSKDYKILEINEQRSFVYKTHYFDTPKFDTYLNHHNKRLNRHKIRQRHYDVNNKFFLEVKQKNNKGKTIKNRIELNGFENLNDESYNFIESYVKIDKHNYTESSSNIFRRITLISFTTKERITIDYDIKFETNNTSKTFKNFAVAELKRERQMYNSPFAKALKQLKIYPRSFSKYCMSLALLKPEIKKNTFKKNILFLNKI